MSTRASATMDLKRWDEEAYSEIDGGPKLVRVSAAKTFHGDIEGEGTLAYLMIYHDAERASFTGWERVVGRIGGRSGSFVLRHDGVFEGGAAKTPLTVEPGSGTGDLRGLRGEGSFIWPHGQPGALTLDYSFEE